jgi:hypothetical protein
MVACPALHTTAGEPAAKKLAYVYYIDPKKEQDIVFNVQITGISCNILNHKLFQSYCARREVIMYSDMTSEDECKWF